MVLLTLFALVAGAATAVTPCVLPVLPALLSASATGGRRRPLGIVIGLAITFTIAVVALASLVKGVGLAGKGVRVLAEVVLIAFGLALIVPGVAARVEAPLARLSRFGPRTRGTGFWSGLGVGGALGFAYTPCAGPILAAVISVSASEGTSARLVTVAVAYAAGSAAVLLVLALGGQWVGDRIKRAGHGLTLQRSLGVVMIATAVAMATQLDVRFEKVLADNLPAFVVDPTHGIEGSHAVKTRLASLRGKPRFGPESAHAAASPKQADGLHNYGPAPEFTDNQRWFNTPGNRPLTLAGLRGHVVLVDFWTYTCINCIRTLPHLEAWDARYRKDGLTIVGVHSPEFPFEHDAGNVKSAIHAEGIEYPVAQDNDLGTWNAYGNQYWPAEYLLDAQGHVRYVHFGEGDYSKDEQAIRTLLAEAGAKNLGAETHVKGLSISRVATPETYVGLARAQGFVVPPTPGPHTYPPAPDNLPQNAFALSGNWTEKPEDAESGAGAAIDLDFVARRVYIVLGTTDRQPHNVRVLLDGRPIQASDAGTDVHNGLMTVRGQRLYNVAALPASAGGRLSLRFDTGIAAYSFTFG
jgi:cytochrome c biogenesis protein CcdA/thiol-disulfide isomerase/thioredoxin